MSRDERVFTVEEVNALIPTLNELVGRQILLQSEIEKGLAELSQLTGRLPGSLEVHKNDSQDVVRLKRNVKERVVEYESGWAKVQELGAVIKDPRIGLLDFYGHVDGRLVWLCWRYGEESLDWYHDLESGYASRKRLDRQLKERLLN